MQCHICGSEMEPIVTDLPFKISHTTIIIIKQLPVLQCKVCPEYLLDDAVMEKVEHILEHANELAELEIVKYAA